MCSSDLYLRIDDRGVWENERSPAVWLNRSSAAGGRIPARFDPRAAPEWHRIGGGSTVRWHDHRVHHVRGGRPGSWRVQIVVDGRPTSVVGELVQVPGPSGAFVVLVVCGSWGIGARIPETVRALVDHMRTFAERNG